MNRTAAANPAPGSVAPTDYAFAAAGVLLTLALQIPFARHHAVLFDEGMILQTAADITQGKVLYRDGVHYAFPGIFYLTAAVFEVFGPSVEAARIFAASLFALATGFLLLMCRWWCTRVETIFFLLVLLSYRVWVFPHWHILNYSPLAVSMALGAAWATGEHIARSNRGWAVAAGIFCGLAILGKQDSGVATALALGVAMLTLRVDTDRHCRWRDAIAFSLATSAVVGACFLAVWQLGFLPDLLREAVYGPIYGVTHYEYLRRPALWPFLAQDQHLRDNSFSYFPQIFMEAYATPLMASWVYRNTGAIDALVKLIYHAPWMIALAATLYLTLASRRDRPRSIAQTRRLLATLLALGFLLAFNRPHDWVHLLMLYQPTLLLVASAVPVLRGRILPRAAAAVAVIALLAASVHFAVEFRRRHGDAVVTPRGTFYTQPALAQGFRDVLDALAQTPADRPLLAYPYHPFFNFLADRPALSRYLSIWPVEWNDARDDEIIAALEARPDATVLYSLSQLIHLGSPRDFAAKLYRYLVDNYSIDPRSNVANPGMTLLLLQRETAPTAGSLLPLIRSAARITKQPRKQAAFDLENGRAEFLEIVDWPFRRTVALKTQPAAEVALRIPVVPRPGDHLRTSCATNPEQWEYLSTPPVRFRLAISSDEGSEQTVFEREVATGIETADRRWFDVDIDLTPWAGRDVEVVLGVFTRWGTPPRGDFAGWEVPRISGEGLE